MVISLKKHNSRSNLLFLLSFLILLSTASLPAQEFVVQGRITDASTSEPLPGANVTIKGTSIGVISAPDGSYRITCRNDRDTLQFSFVGLETQIIPVEGRNRIDVALSVKAEILDEIVVIGYGTVKKKDLTGAVSVVSSEQIAKTNSMSFDRAIQGKAAGVWVTNTSGRPGSEVSVKIRGIGSINRESEPLYVIDGFPITGGLNHLNPNDIESVNILKDASATAIYGARGANGVVMITTRRGKKGEPQVSFSSYVSYSKIPRLYDILNADEYVALMDSAYRYYNSDPFTTVPMPFPVAYSDSVRALNGNIDTDWQKEISQPAVGQNYDLRILGGGEKSTYMISGNFYNENGILIGTSMTRYTLKANSDFSIGKRIKIGESFNFSNIGVDDQSHYTNGNPWIIAAKTSPLMPVYDKNNKGGYAGPTPEVTPVNERTNPVAEQMLNDNTNRSTRFLVSLYGEVEIFKGFRFRTNFGYDMNFYQVRQWNPVYELGTIGGRSRYVSTLFMSRDQGGKYFWDKQLIYENTFGRHNLALTFVHTNEDGKGESLSGKGANFDFENLNVLAMADPTTYTASGYAGQERMESYLGRIIYDYNGRYFLTASIRKDGSSKFGPKHKWGTFPSFSAAWKFSEDLLQKYSWITSGKLRIGYGVTGNENIGSFQYESYIEPKVEFVTAMGDPGRTVFGRGPLYNFGNAAIQWEEASMTNLGLDLILFRNQLEFTFEYYYKDQQKMLATIPISSVHGRLEGFEPWGNVANMINKGIELNLTYRKSAGKWKYSLNGNLTTIKNTVTNLPAGRNIIESHSITMKGHTISSFYGYIADGIFQSWEDVNNHAFQNEKTSPGDIRFRDINRDGKVTDLDRVIIGKPVPDFTYGFNLDAGYGQFDLAVFLYGVQNVDIYNDFRANAGLATDPEGKDNNKLREALDFWSPSHHTNKQVRASIIDPNDNNRISSFFIENGSFLRIKNLQVGYTFPPKLLSYLRVRSIRVYFNASNLYTFTKYTGYDPEIGSKQNLNFGIDYGNYPLPRTFMGGVQIDF